MRPVERFPSREAADDIRQRLRDLPQDPQPPYDWTEFRRRERQAAWPRRTLVKWEHAAAAAGVTVLIASMAMWAHSDRWADRLPDHLADHPAPQNLASSGVTTAPLATPRVTPQATPLAASASAPTPDQSSPAVSTDTNAQANEEINSLVTAAANDRASKASLAAQAAVAAQLAAFAGAPASRRWLEQQPAEPTLVRVGSRYAVANLEDRIAWMDDALTDAQFNKGSTANLRMLQNERARLVSSLAQVRYAETLAAAQ